MTKRALFENALGGDNMSWEDLCWTIILNLFDIEPPDVTAESE